MTITAAEENLLLYPGHSLKAGQQIRVVEGPVDAEGYYWRSGNSILTQRLIRVK